MSEKGGILRTLSGYKSFIVGLKMTVDSLGVGAGAYTEVRLIVDENVQVIERLEVEREGAEQVILTPPSKMAEVQSTNAEVKTADLSAEKLDSEITSLREGQAEGQKDDALESLSDQSDSSTENDASSEMTAEAANDNVASGAPANDNVASGTPANDNAPPSGSQAPASGSQAPSGASSQSTSTDVNA